MWLNKIIAAMQNPIVMHSIKVISVNAGYYIAKCTVANNLCINIFTEGGDLLCLYIPC